MDQHIYKHTGICGRKYTFKGMSEPGVGCDNKQSYGLAVCSSFLPEQRVVAPLQFLFAWHVLRADPRKMYPGLQVNCRKLWKVNPLPDIAPFVGVVSEGQIITERKRCKQYILRGKKT